MSLTRPLYFRLSGLMFVQFIPLGMVFPLFSLIMKDSLSLEGWQIGLIMAVGAAAGTFSPLLTALFSDRLVRSHHLKGLLNILSGLTLLTLPFCQSFETALLVFSLFMAFKGPTFSLVNSISFHHLAQFRDQFPAIRLWGTLGWLAGGWTLSGLWVLFPQLDLNAAVFGAAGTSILAGFYSFTLPPMPLYPWKKPEALPTAPKEPPATQAKKIFTPELLLFLGLTLLMTIADRFYVFSGGPFLSKLGWPQEQILLLLSLGQISEALFMGFIPGLLRKFGFRWVFALGAALEALRFVFLSVSGLPVFLVGAVVLHGFIFCLFFANGTIYVDRVTNPANRSRIHQLYGFLLEGVGVSAGNMGAGILVVQQLSAMEVSSMTWNLWAVPLILSLAASGGFLLFMKKQVQGEAEPASPGPLSKGAQGKPG